MKLLGLTLPLRRPGEAWLDRRFPFLACSKCGVARACASCIRSRWSFTLVVGLVVFDLLIHVVAVAYVLIERASR